jgi:hypothetical protein
MIRDSQQKTDFATEPHRDPALITHSMADILWAHVFAISAFRHVHVP